MILPATQLTSGVQRRTPSSGLPPTMWSMRLCWAAGRTVPSSAPATPTRQVMPPASPGPTTTPGLTCWGCPLAPADFSPTRPCSGWRLAGSSLGTTSAGLPGAPASNLDLEDDDDDGVVGD